MEFSFIMKKENKHILDDKMEIAFSKKGMIIIIFIVSTIIYITNCSSIVGKFSGTRILEIFSKQGDQPLQLCLKSGIQALELSVIL